jgi:serine/threonine-protein kinase RsbW
VVEIAPLSTTTMSSETNPSSETKLSLQTSQFQTSQFQASAFETSQFETNQFETNQFEAHQFETKPSPFSWLKLQDIRARWVRAKWGSLSFASTLYLYPVIDSLLEHVPEIFHDEVRLGLQEALVNAAKHGNCLDPSKTVSVRYSRTGNTFRWVISDQGSGFCFPATCGVCPQDDHESLTSECGRGLFILYQVFDEVSWCNEGKEVHLCKQMKSPFPLAFNLPWGRRLTMAVSS